MYFRQKCRTKKKKILKIIFRGLRIFFPTPEFCAEFGFRIHFRWKIRQCALPTRQKEEEDKLSQVPPLEDWIFALL